MILDGFFCSMCGAEFPHEWQVRIHIGKEHQHQGKPRAQSAALSVDEMARLNGMKRTNKEWLEHSHYAN